MKTTAITRRLLCTGLLIGGMTLWSSCDGCSRSKTVNESTQTESGDAQEINGEIYGKGTPADRERSGTRSGTPLDTVDTGTGYGNTNDPIENTSSNAVSKKGGEPRDSGGTSGAGMGTGTGTTGNNSKVTRPEDQRD